MHNTAVNRRKTMTTAPKNWATLKTNSSAASRINIRYAPDGEEVKTDRPHGFGPVRVIAESSKDRNGYIWYKIIYSDDAANDIGWVREDVIDIESLDWKDELEPEEGEASKISTDENTILFFETQERAIRVFNPQGKLRLNIYNKMFRKTQLHQVKAIGLPDIVCAPDGSKVRWQGYVAEQNNRVYIARFVPLQQVELIVSNAITGEVFSRAAGFGSKGIAYRGLQ